MHDPLTCMTSWVVLADDTRFVCLVEDVLRHLTMIGAVQGSALVFSAVSCFVVRMCIGRVWLDLDSDQDVYDQYVPILRCTCMYSI